MALLNAIAELFEVIDDLVRGEAVGEDFDQVKGLGEATKLLLEKAVSYVIAANSCQRANRGSRGPNSRSICCSIQERSS